MKIVINQCFGGFSLSQIALDRLRELGETSHIYDIPRDSKELIQIIEELGKDAETRYSQLKIIEIPDNIDWEIEEYDGKEWIAEKHKTWGK